MCKDIDYKHKHLHELYLKTVFKLTFKKLATLRNFEVVSYEFNVFGIFSRRNYAQKSFRKLYKRF
jgi:hypothetical protein